MQTNGKGADSVPRRERVPYARRRRDSPPYLRFHLQCRRKTSVALWPPKPRLSVSTVSIFASRFTFGV